MSDSEIPVVRDVNKKRVRGQFRCPECDAVFKYRSALNMHLETHKSQGEREKFLCTEGCGKNFSSRKARRRHEKANCPTLVPRKQCSECEKLLPSYNIGHCLDCEPIKVSCYFCWIKSHKTSSTQVLHRFLIGSSSFEMSPVARREDRPVTQAELLTPDNLVLVPSSLSGETTPRTPTEPQVARFRRRDEPEEQPVIISEPEPEPEREWQYVPNSLERQLAESIARASRMRKPPYYKRPTVIKRAKDFPHMWEKPP